MPNNQEEQSQSTGKELNGSLPNNQPENLANIYRHIIDCPLRCFIDATVDNNLAALIRSGMPAIELLEEARGNLVQEYAEILGDAESKMYMELLREVSLLDLDYQTIQVIVACLRNTHIQYLTDDLNELIKHSPRFKFDPKDQVQYQKDLDRCLNRSKSILIRHTMKKSQLDAMTKKNQGAERPDRNYYLNILYTLEDHAKRELGENITVHQFATRIKKYNEYCKRQNAPQK